MTEKQEIRVKSLECAILLTQCFTGGKYLIKNISPSEPTGILWEFVTKLAKQMEAFILDAPSV